MKKLLIILMVLAIFMIRIPEGVASEELKQIGDKQIPPTEHPLLIHQSFETVGDRKYRMELGFGTKTPFVRNYFLTYYDLNYKIEYIVINNQKIYPKWAVEGRDDVYYEFGYKVVNLFSPVPSDVWMWYEITFDKVLPPDINNKWYVNEIKFQNMSYDFVSDNGEKYPTYLFEYDDLSKYPRIVLEHGDVFHHELGYLFVEPGYTAFSTYDETLSLEERDITNRVVEDYGSITPGEPIEVEDSYIINYTVEDDFGNVGSTTRLLVIGDAEPPLINEDPEPETPFVEDGTDTATDNTESSFDFEQFLLDYWWVGLIIAFAIIMFATNSFTKSFAVTIIIFVILLMIYGNELIDLSLEGLIIDGLTETVESRITS
ncbi:hypothetical protein KHQ82_05375 [Mycoplasmatota bacterium]|nr:hypothetical protein KHQ82_05375 [Mycoplasmatota bacterium]